MNARDLVKASVFVILSTLLLSINAIANPTTVTGFGSTIQPQNTKDISMVYEKVTISLLPRAINLEPELKDIAKYSGQYRLRNLTPKKLKVTVGFPIDTGFVHDPTVKSDSFLKWYHFKVQDNNRVYRAKCSITKDHGYYKTIMITWDMIFNPDQEIQLTVGYQIPVYYDYGESGYYLKCDNPLINNRLNQYDFQEIKYITVTGQSWAGKIDEAHFSVEKGQFESDLPSFSWGKGYFQFRTIKPDGWQDQGDKIVWNYSEFNPVENISVSYYITRIPSTINNVKETLKTSPEYTRADLLEFREVILGCMGVDPKDKVAQGFLNDQPWYPWVQQRQITDLSVSEINLIKYLDELLSK